MEIGLIFALMLGVMTIGYALGVWHDASESDLEIQLLEQRIERMAKERIYTPMGRN